MKLDATPGSAAQTSTGGHYAALFASMQEGLLVADLIARPGEPVDFRYIDVNPMAEQMLGIPREQIVGRTAREIIPEVQEDLLELCARVVRTGISESREVFEPLVQQHHRSVFFRSAPGQVAVVFTDVTERKRTEEALAAAAKSLALERERLDTLVSSIDDHLVSYDSQWRYTFVNDAAARVLGRTRDELLGRSIWELFPGAVGNEYYQALHTVARERRAIRQEHYYEPFKCWFENHIYPSADGVTVFASDITARKTAEAALRESEERFRVMADGLALIVWVHGADGSQEFVNQRACEFFGVGREGTRGIHGEFPVHPDDYGAYVGGFRSALERQQPFHETARVRRADGEWRWIESWGRPRFAGNGEFTGMVGASVDVTERLVVERMLRETDQRKNEFLAMLAHELRNPLAAIKSAVDLLRGSVAHAGAVPAAFGILDRQVDHMVRQVDDLLDVSRISRGAIELRRERIDLAEVVRQVAEGVDARARAQEQTLTVLMPARPVYVDADATRLAQVVGNLLSNAFKFTGRRGEIRVAVAEEQDRAVLRVSDDGIGIPADALERIFGMFTQLDTSGELGRGGLGVGLTLVRTLVEYHGGTVRAESAGPGLGSQFTVSLPLSRGVGAATTPPPAAHAAPARRRILVVDDNRDAADMLAVLLARSGHEVMTVYSGREALDAAPAFTPDVVLMDIGMPGIDGYETGRRLRDMGLRVRLVALTGWGNAGDRRRSTDAGFDAHLVKPARIEQIDALLLEWSGARSRPETDLTENPTFTDGHHP